MLTHTDFEIAPVIAAAAAQRHHTWLRRDVYAGIDRLRARLADLDAKRRLVAVAFDHGDRLVLWTGPRHASDVLTIEGLHNHERIKTDALDAARCSESLATHCPDELRDAAPGRAWVVNLDVATSTVVALAEAARFTAVPSGSNHAISDLTELLWQL